MPTHGGEFECAPRALLPANVREVRPGLCAKAVRRERRLGLELALSAQIRDRLGEVPDRDRGYTGERSLSRRVGRTKEALGTQSPRALGDGEDASDTAQAAVERELPDRSRPLERGARELLRRREQCEGDRQVEA